MNHMFIIISFNPILHASSFHLERFDSNKHIGFIGGANCFLYTSNTVVFGINHCR